MNLIYIQKLDIIFNNLNKFNFNKKINKFFFILIKNK